MSVGCCLTMEQHERGPDAAGQRSGLREEDDEREWCCTADDRKTSLLALAVASSELTGNCYKDVFQAADLQGFRVIVHIDLDCFYAQVETMQHPEYRGMPLAVHQKHLVVTCNYEARRYGVNKMMSVSVAKERCPDVILICGEDLTPYREASYQITELLEEFSPLVERLGFDENFVDITELVEKRLQRIGSGVVPADLFVSGHVYGNQALNPADGKHVRLALGSKIGDEMRGAIYERIGLTSSAGIASNKLQAKLVSGTFKPNRQTTLLPESVLDCMGNLMHLKQIPGIGPKTVRRLEFHGVHTIHALQTFPLDLLEKELGVCAAQRIHKLSFGEDDYPVTPRGPPQSLSNEDSFRKCSSLVEIRTKLEELLISLLIRFFLRGRVTSSTLNPGTDGGRAREPAGFELGISRLESSADTTTPPAKDLSFIQKVSALAKKVQQCLYFHGGLQRFSISSEALPNFYRSAVESILTGLTQPGTETPTPLNGKAYKKKWMQPRPSQVKLSPPFCTPTQSTVATPITMDAHHPAHVLFSLLPSEKGYRSLRTTTTNPSGTGTVITPQPLAF
ncbi:DNA polymerase iota isoform X4 [Hemitrygon akajei]|uniref:DNA polymerase iota isoform X4 n=1 Tax=Hemitrygon akajei TaxID=2704970 RepID=UPI003BF9BD47